MIIVYLPWRPQGWDGVSASAEKWLGAEPALRDGRLAAPPPKDQD
jgi:hypothetical protein